MEEAKRQQLIEALVHVALLECKELSAHFAVICEALEKREHLVALGALQVTEEQFRFLGVALTAAARVRSR